MPPGAGGGGATAEVAGALAGPPGACGDMPAALESAAVRDEIAKRRVRLPSAPDGPPGELRHVHPPAADLAPVHPPLALAQPLSELALRQARGLAQLPQEPRDLEVSQCLVALGRHRADFGAEKA